MDTNNADILQIKKYLEGKLDARAMHELERRALDDPFLMDALEGYEGGGNQDKAAVELDESLKKRLQKPKRRVISIRALAMAASVIAVLTVGGWWFYGDKAAESANVATKVAEQDNTEVTGSALSAEPEIAINKDSVLVLNSPKAVIRSPRTKRAYRQTEELNDVSVSSDETFELAASAIPGTGTLEEVTMRSRSKADSVPLNEMLVMGMAGQRKKADVPAASVPASATAKVIQGKVVSATDGEPLPGVTVRAGNTGTVAVTGANGSYTLKVDSLNTDLTYNYIGFRSRQLKANGNTAPNTVVLEPESSSLNEVVVVGHGENAAEATAHPKSGWESYQKYLNANAVAPNGKKGTYRVSFTVEKDGTLTNFETNKAGDDAAGQKAIQLIKNGPEWIGNAKKEEKKVITIKFKEAGN